MRKRVFSLLLVATMVISLAACGSAKETVESESAVAAEETKDETSGDAQSENTEPVTISLYPGNANLTSGQMGGYRGEYLLENGLILDVWAYSDEKKNAILASGDLPDVMYFNNQDDLKAITESGYLLDLEPYMEKMPFIAANDTLQSAMQFAKENVTGGVMSVVPLSTGAVIPANDTERFALKLNWEVYEAIGAPEFSNLQELIPILKQMQEYYPEAEDGSKTYAMFMSPSLDGTYFYGAYDYLTVCGYDAGKLPYFIEVDAVNESYDYILEDDSKYKEALAFYNQLYREGLYDPESITRERSNAVEKLAAGHALASWVSVPGFANAGLLPVWYEDCVISYPQVNPFGNGYYIAVNAKSENLDAALKFVDLLANPDSTLILGSGPQGELWDLDDSGNPILTEKGISYAVKGEAVTLEDGESFSGWPAMKPLNDGEVTSYGVTPGLAGWQETLDLLSDSETMEKWKATTGYNSFMEQLEDKDAIIKDPFHNGVDSFVAQPTDEQSLIISAGKELVVTASWQMIYAETDEAFEKIWTTLVEECEELGTRDIADWRREEYIKAEEKKASYFK